MANKAIFFLILLIWSFDSHAYVDPGTGSLFFQTLLAIIAGGLYTIKLYWAKIKNIFKKNDNKKKD